MEGGLVHNIKGELVPDSPGVHVLCPTRWTVCAESMLSVINNYTVFQELCEQAAEIVTDNETVAHTGGVAAQMQPLEFFVGLVRGENLLQHTDNMSYTIQSKCSASEGQKVAEMTRKNILLTRNEQSFDLYVS